MDFEINPTLPKKFNKNEVKIFNDSINQFAKNGWEKIRPIDLKIKELEYIHYTDSLREYYHPN